MSSELSVIGKQIYDVLSGDSQIHAGCADRIYAAAAPAKAVYPCIVFRTMAPADSVGGGGTRICTRSLMLIEVIGAGGYEAIDTLVVRVDDLFRASAPQVLTDGSIISSYREEPFEAIEQDDKVTYYRRGGMYRFLVRTI